MKILVATFNTPLFVHEGLRLSERWSEVDLSTASPETVDALEMYMGSHIQVHPDHLEQFVEAVGLELHEGKLRYRGGPTDTVLEASGVPKIGERHQHRASGQAAPHFEHSPAPSLEDELRSDIGKLYGELRATSSRADEAEEHAESLRLEIERLRADAETSSKELADAKAALAAKPAAEPPVEVEQTEPTKPATTKPATTKKH